MRLAIIGRNYRLRQQAAQRLLAFPSEDRLSLRIPSGNHAGGVYCYYCVKSCFDN